MLAFSLGVAAPAIKKEGRSQMSANVTIPVAGFKDVYDVGDVEKALQDLSPTANEALRAVYEKMLRLGGQRFTVKPSALPDMAQPLPPSEWVEQAPCRICPGRPAGHTQWRLCRRHLSQWKHQVARADAVVDFIDWLAVQQPWPGYDACLVAVCPSLAESPLGLCFGHDARYRKDGRPSGASGDPSRKAFSSARTSGRSDRVLAAARQVRSTD